MNNNSQILRKIRQIRLKLLKKVHHNNDKPAILINSFPKSGTHLLYQLFEN